MNRIHAVTVIPIMMTASRTRILFRIVRIACFLFHSSTEMVAIPSVLRSAILIPPASSVMFPVSVLPVDVPSPTADLAFVGHERFLSAGRGKPCHHRFARFPSFFGQCHHNLLSAELAVGHVLIQILSAHGVTPSCFSFPSSELR